MLAIPCVKWGQPSADTVGRWLAQAGRWSRKRKRARRRSRRPRRVALGELVQWDSSVHAWLEDRGPGDLVLVALHDDATGRMLHGQFVARDTGAANRRAIIACLKRHGRPLAVYADHAAHFGQRARDGKRTRSVIARGLEKLGVELVLAGSPQAKGRVERTFGTAQDRLVKEMRVAGVATLEAANQFLEERWIPFWNERFAVAIGGASRCATRSNGRSGGASGASPGSTCPTLPATPVVLPRPE